MGSDNKDKTHEELIAQIQSLEQKNNRLMAGMQYLTELAKEKLDDEEVTKDSGVFILLLQILDVVNDSIKYDFDFERGD